MQSRTESLLESAVDYLTAPDVFGSQYEGLLRSDIRALKRAISLAERELGEVVDVS